MVRLHHICMEPELDPWHSCFSMYNIQESHSSENESYTKDEVKNNKKDYRQVL